MPIDIPAAFPYSAMIQNKVTVIPPEDEGKNKPFASSPRIDDWWDYYPGLESEGIHDLKPKTVTQVPKPTFTEEEERHVNRERPTSTFVSVPRQAHYRYMSTKHVPPVGYYENISYDLVEPKSPTYKMYYPPSEVRTASPRQFRPLRKFYTKPPPPKPSPVFTSVSREKPPANHIRERLAVENCADREYDLDSGYKATKQTDKSNLNFVKKCPKKFHSPPEEVIPFVGLQYDPSYSLTKPRTDHTISWDKSSKKGSFIKPPEDMSIKNSAFWKMYAKTTNGNPSALDYDDRVLSTRHKHVWSVPLQKVVSRPTLTHISDKRQKGLYTQPGELDVNISQTSPRVPTFDMSKSAY